MACSGDVILHSPIIESNLLESSRGIAISEVLDPVIADTSQTDSSDNARHVQRNRFVINDSDSEPDERVRLQSVSTLRKKRFTFGDSDSENEHPVIPRAENIDSEESRDSQTAESVQNLKKMKKRIIFNDSDSDEEIIDKQGPSKLNIDAFASKLSSVDAKKSNNEDSDSDLEALTNFGNKILGKDLDKDEKQITNDNDSEKENQDSTNIQNNDNDHSSHCDDFFNEDIKSKGNKNKTGSVRKSAQRAAKQIAEQRMEIKSTTQKMIREKRFCLPYHRPKVNTLQNFLERHNRLAVNVQGKNASPSVALKTSVKELSKQLEERKKVIEELYKSESESEEEPEQTEVAEEPKRTEKTESTLIATTADEIEGVGLLNTETVRSVTDTNKPDESNLVEPVPVSNNKEIEILEKLDEVTENDVPKENIGKEIHENISEFNNIKDSEVSSNTEVKENNGPKENNGKEIHEDISEFNNNKDSGRSSSTEGTVTAVENNCANEELNLQQPEMNPCLNNETNNVTEQTTLPEKNSYQLKNSVAENENAHVDASDNTKLLDMEKERVNAIILRYINEDDVANIMKVTENPNISDTDIANPEASKKPKLSVLLPSLKTFRPQLHGSSNDTITLTDETVSRPKAISNLMQRFLKQSVKKDAPKKVELNVVSVEGGSIHQETVAVNIDPEDKPPILEQPGVRLKMLREELEKHMAQKRFEIWEKRNNESVNKVEDISEAEKVEYDPDDEILDDEEEETELTESESEEEEDEEVEIREKTQPKSVFIDSEAEEEDEEDVTEDIDEEEFEEEDQNTSEVPQHSPKKEEVKEKKLRRIKAAFVDSDSEDVRDPEINSGDKSDTSNEDDEIPPHQPRNNGAATPYKPITQSKSDLGFLTPVFRLSALQSTSSVKDFTVSPTSPFSLPPEPSPLRDRAHKKLFGDEATLTDTQTNIEELEALCSGRFTESQTSDRNPMEFTQESVLLGLCSGEFPSTQEINSILNVTQTEKSATVLPESQELSSTLNPETDTNLQAGNTKKDEDNFNLVWSDDETEPEAPQKIKKPIQPRFVVVSSDEETDEPKFRKKNKKIKLKFSDDELSLTDDESVASDPPEDNRVVDYDSEENEIELDPSEEKEAEPLAPADFFEDEAELSESEWGSADEDEQGLDVLETEKGDAENFNEAKLQRDLERIHMRQVLDDDNREVRLLQELLLEDGEFHGVGRQRQFRWKDIDKIDDEEIPRGEDAEFLFEEEFETEEEWRKMRHRRESYLREQKEKTHSQMDELRKLSNNSQILRLGHVALQKTISVTESKPAAIVKTVEKQEEAVIKLPFTLLSKRGSFLARSESTLTKIAEMTKPVSNSSSSLKNAKNFVFTSVDSKTVVNRSEEKKRKASEGTPNAIKKLRLNEFSPGFRKDNRRKQLFNTSQGAKP